MTPTLWDDEMMKAVERVREAIGRERPTERMSVLSVAIMQEGADHGLPDLDIIVGFVKAAASIAHALEDLDIQVTMQ